jgi:hypothetical protein
MTRARVHKTSNDLLNRCLRYIAILLLKNASIWSKVQEVKRLHLSVCLNSRSIDLADEIAAIAGEILVELADHRNDEFTRHVTVMFTATAFSIENKKVSRALMWQAAIPVYLVGPGPLLGYDELGNPMYEGTPVHMLAGQVGLLSGVPIYSAVSYFMLRATTRSRSKDLAYATHSTGLAMSKIFIFNVDCSPVNSGVRLL